MMHYDDDLGYLWSAASFYVPPLAARLQRAYRQREVEAIERVHEWTNDAPVGRTGNYRERPSWWHGRSG